MPTVAKKRRSAGPKGAKPVAAVARACSLLDAFRNGPAVLSLAELSQRTGLYKSTVLRLAGTLEQYGLLQKGADGRYHIGASVFQLSRRYQASMPPEDVLLPIITWLVEQTGESAGFHVPLDGQRMCLAQVNSPQQLRSHFKAGDILPLERGAGGKALTLYAAGQSGLRKNARMVVSAANEHSDGMTGLACPVFDDSGALAGVIALSGPTVRFTRAAVADFEKKLTEAARRATVALGGDDSPYVGRRRQMGKERQIA